MSSNPAPGAHAFPAFDGTLGATLVGAVMATFLFGIASLQAFNYYRSFPEDTKRLKILVR